MRHLLERGVSLRPQQEVSVTHLFQQPWCPVLDSSECCCHLEKRLYTRAIFLDRQKDTVEARDGDQPGY